MHIRFKFLSAALCLAACGIEANSQTTANDYADPAFRSPVVAVEFTGQRCRYCPNLSRSLKGSEEKYGRDNYIITALHHLEEYSSLPPQHVSLYHPEAQKYASSIEVHTGLPQLAYNSLGPDIDDLLLDDMFKQPDLLECTGKVEFNDRKELIIDLSTRLRRDRVDYARDKQIDILFWAMENDIVALQDDNGKWTYPAHQHIFRGSVNTTWGEPYTIGSAYKKTFAFPETVSVPANGELVVFFLDRSSKVILDAARFPFTPQDVTGIDNATLSPVKGQPAYQLNGQPAGKETKGNVYIRGGRKYIAR